jgi:hypothetical protein
MQWHPIGPDFVFWPRNPNFQRLSRRNEWGKQGMVYHIAVDPTDARTLYVVMRPWSGGTAAFRTQNDGALWTPISDTLQQQDPTVDPMCIAVNPTFPQYIYLGTHGGSTWAPMAGSGHNLEPPWRGRLLGTTDRGWWGRDQADR